LIAISTVEPVRNHNAGESIMANSDLLIRERYESYLSDESGLGPGNVETVFLPADEKQVADFLSDMNRRKIPVTISGGRTGIVGGAVPDGGALLSLDQMKGIRGIKWDDQSHEWRVIVEPGIRLRDFQQAITTKTLLKEPGSSDSNWKDLQRFLDDPNQYFYAPDPTEDSASMGGTVATDASGARTYFYGRTREHVRALRIVLPTGEVLPLRRGENTTDYSRVVALHRLRGSVTLVPIPTYESPNVKCVSGYYSKKNMDLIDLFIGSEGTLGVITQVEVALKVKPRTSMCLAFFPTTNDGITFVLNLRKTKNDLPLQIHSIEFFDENSVKLIRELKEIEEIRAGMRLPDKAAAILLEFAYHNVEELQPLIEAFEHFHSMATDTIVGMSQPDKDRLRALRHALPEAINRAIAKRKASISGLHKLGTDTAVPDDKLLDLMSKYYHRLQESGLEYFVFGHIAENHLHVNILPSTLIELEQAEALVRDMARDAVALGGAVSAEHGIGKLKQDFLKLMYDESKIQEMRATKKAFDPNWILCPGNIFK
jgi:D-lactate dehydrogenase (cytochrome)